MKQYYFCSRSKLMQLSISNLNEIMKSIKSDIDKIDSVLYTDKLNRETLGMKKKEKENYTQRLVDKRYNLVRARGTIESVYRERRLAGLNISSKALNHGVYTDVHTVNLKPTSRGHWAGLRGITL